MPLISVVIPVYRAEGCVAELCRRLKLSLGTITEDFEIILVEDRSPDSSWQMIQNEAERDPRIRGLRLARNFGQHRAITAGLDIADGDWVVVMDCDLQDPPEEIPRLYAKALEGYQIVMANFEERKESKTRQLVSKLFWFILSKLAGFDFDFKNGNFRIMSRLVVQSFRQYREQLRLLGGITNMMGFTTCSISVSRQERHAGETSYTLRKLIAAALEICMAYSDKPLRLAVGVGLAISLGSLLLGIWFIILEVTGVVLVPGWASVIVSIYLVSGLIMASIGLLGYYIGRIFDEVKKRPLYLVEQRTASSLVDTQRQDGQKKYTGRVFWITGLSASGKTTLGLELTKRLKTFDSKVVFLDGDELREVFGTTAMKTENHGRDGRMALAMQYAHLCKVISEQGFTVVIATISLFREVHSWNRKNLPGYFEVYLKVPLVELRRRDPKGIYRRYDTGEIQSVAGLDLPVDEPESADWTAEFSPERTVDELASHLIKIIQKQQKTNEN
jgi:dolichol-phosphate mannosyltransferase